MRRVLLPVVLVVLICCWTAPTYGQVPTGDSVVGQGRTRPYGPYGVEWTFELEAHSGPSGEDPSGLVDLGFRLHIIPTNFVHVAGHVTCLSVSGNDAVVGFEPDPPGAFGFTGWMVHVVDNGPPGSDPPDTVTPVTDGSEPPSCVLPPSPLLDVEEGDVTVTDAPALPTSRSECLNGGWRAFPGFKNQGQCIAFVTRGP
jgi:hypothetical protein